GLFCPRRDDLQLENLDDGAAKIVGRDSLCEHSHDSARPHPGSYSRHSAARTLLMTANVASPARPAHDERSSTVMKGYDLLAGAEECGWPARTLCRVDERSWSGVNPVAAMKREPSRRQGCLRNSSTPSPTSGSPKRPSAACSSVAGSGILMQPAW